MKKDYKVKNKFEEGEKVMKAILFFKNGKQETFEITEITIGDFIGIDLKKGMVRPPCKNYLEHLDFEPKKIKNIEVLI